MEIVNYYMLEMARVALGLRFGNRCTDVYIELGKGDESTEVIEGVTRYRKK